MATRSGRKHRFGHSTTGLDLAEKCPGAFKLKKIDKVPEVRVLPRDRGGLVHEIAAEYLRRLVRECGGHDVTLAKDVARKHFKNQDKVPASLYPEVLEMAETLAATFELDWVHVTGIERFFTLKLGDAQYVFRGIKDLELVDGAHAHIVDWKTSYEILGERKLRQTPQARNYALALFLQNPEVVEVRVTFGFLRHGVYPYVDFERDEIVPEVELELVAAIEKLEARQEWPFTEGSHCGVCDYATPERCERLAAIMGSSTEEFLELNTLPGPITSDPQSQEVAGRLVLLDRVRKDLTKALSAWSSPHGPVPAGDLAYAHWPVRYKKRDPRTISRLLHEDGLEPFDALKVDNKALEKLVLGQGSPALIQAVEAATTETAFSRFEARKRREEVPE